MSTVHPPAPLSRQQEKAELQQLNDRYKAYIGKVRKMREEANRVDSSALLNSIRMLEDEIEVIKNMYEKELSNLRHQLEETAAARSSADTQAHRNGQLAADLQDRLSVENQRSRVLNDDVASMQHLCAQKEVDLQTSHALIADLTRKLQDLEDDHANLQRKADDLQHRFDQECVLRKDAQDSNQILHSKLDFQKQVNDEEIADLKHTLDDKTNHILALEAKVRELARPDNTLQEMLDRVKRAAAEELQRFKEESEAVYHRNLQELRDQMDLDAANMAKLADENSHLVKEIDLLNNNNQELNNKVLAMEQMNNNLNHQMETESERSAVHVRALEDKLRDMQDSLVQKMREITLATDGKAPMRAEIEALKVLVEEEENKLQHIPPALTHVPTSLSLSSTKPYISARPRTVSPVRSSHFENKTGLSTSYTAKTPKSRPLSVPATMGQGKDYFDSIFGGLQKSTWIYPRLHPKSSPPGVYRVPTTSHDYTTSTSSTTGNIRFLEISPEGHFVRLFNTSAFYEEEVGGFMIQQNVGGHPVAVYRFPPRTRFRAASTITIWAASSLAKHNPPTDFLWKEQHKWGTGPECTTILCKPNGQAVAWTTAAHRFSRTAQSYDQQSESSDQNMADEDKGGESNLNPAFEVEINGRPTTVLRRGRAEPSSLSPAKHPTGQYTGHSTHPATGQPRVRTLGNDGSSSCRQSRSQNSKPVPDRTPAVLYASSGVGATRTGSAPLRKPLRTTPSKSGTIRVGSQPSPFMSPHHQHYSNINKINASHHVSFQPPLPRPPVISSW